jgi:hypothetical protein
MPTKRRRTSSGLLAAVEDVAATSSKSWKVVADGRRSAATPRSSAKPAAPENRLRARRSERIDQAVELTMAAGASSQTDAVTQLLELAAELVLDRAELAQTRARRDALLRGDEDSVDPARPSVSEAEAEAMLREARGEDR